MPDVDDDDGIEIDQVQSELRQGIGNAKRLVDRTKSLLSGDRPPQLT